MASAVLVDVKGGLGGHMCVLLTRHQALDSACGEQGGGGGATFAIRATTVQNEGETDVVSVFAWLSEGPAMNG